MAGSSGSTGLRSAGWPGTQAEGHSQRQWEQHQPRGGVAAGNSGGSGQRFPERGTEFPPGGPGGGTVDGGPGRLPRHSPCPDSPACPPLSQAGAPGQPAGPRKGFPTLCPQQPHFAWRLLRGGVPPPEGTRLARWQVWGLEPQAAGGKERACKRSRCRGRPQRGGLFPLEVQAQAAGGARDADCDSGPGGGCLKSRVGEGRADHRPGSCAGAHGEPSPASGRPTLLTSQCV